MIKKLALAGALLVFLCPALANAADAEGTITSIDETANTITLDDGKTYNLPGEFDYSVLNQGMKVLVFFDAQGNNRYVTDIEPDEG